ncbi:MAG TPA: hypothetical protein DC049_03425, partial [Spirochaetia bacterium]|nr:hypothetical protein [Spirochaetia bacterium]
HQAENRIVPLTAWTDMRIGYSRVNNGYFHGIIDDVRIYNRALSNSEISYLYNNLADIIIENYPVESYCSSEDRTLSQYETLDYGKTLHLWGNNWKAIPFPVTISATSVLEFDFNCEVMGEVNGIGLDTQILNINSGRFFNIYGTQTWGIMDYDNQYPGSGWKHYIIPIGRHFTGSFNYITFANDDDAHSQSDISFRNIRIFEPE